MGDTSDGFTQPASQPLGTPITFITGSGVQRATVWVKNKRFKGNPDLPLPASPQPDSAYRLTNLWVDTGPNFITIYSEGHPEGDPFDPHADPKKPNIDVDGNDVEIQFTW